MVEVGFEIKSVISQVSSLLITLPDVNASHRVLELTKHRPLITGKNP